MSDLFVSKNNDADVCKTKITLTFQLIISLIWFKKSFWILQVSKALLKNMVILNPNMVILKAEKSLVTVSVEKAE